MKFKKHSQMVEHKLASFMALWTLVTLLIKLIRIILKWKYIQDKNYAILAAMLQKQSYFVKNVSSRSLGWSVHIGEFSAWSPKSRSQKHVIIFTKKRVARRDLGHRASPIDQAHMKRPLDSF